MLSWKIQLAQGFLFLTAPNRCKKSIFSSKKDTKNKNLDAQWEEVKELGSSGINMLNQIHLTDLHGFQPSGKALKCL
jgi:hypothetical protein